MQGIDAGDSFDSKLHRVTIADLFHQECAGLRCVFVMHLHAILFGLQNIILVGCQDLDTKAPMYKLLVLLGQRIDFQQLRALKT